MTAMDDVARPDLRVLVVTGGHPFEMEPFLDVFASMGGISWEHLQPPEAMAAFRGEAAGRYDAIVCYDMQGIEFRKPDPPRFALPPPEYATGITDLLEAGQGIVFLHHAMSAWPAWELWPRIVGGRWHYMPGELAGTRYPASGYTREVEHHISVLDADHPVCAGLGAGFEIVDEVYLNPVLTEIIHPLLRTGYPMDSGAFFSGQLAITGHMYSSEGWSHPDGTGLVGWVKAAGRSPVAYLQPGHGPAAYANPGFRRLLSNAIGWAASAQARDWAAANPLPLR
ncbi:MAG TPA: ThuA domain-containing protein [Streptosporangiaceae bacterium]